MLRALHDWLTDFARPRPQPRAAPRALVHYWINPVAATDRAAWMRAQFERACVANRRVDARTPDDLPRIALAPRHAPSALQLACLASHFSALEHAVADGEEFFVVIEDDMTLHFDVDFGRLIATAPLDWEILQLYVVRAERLHAMYTRSYRRRRLWERWRIQNHSTGAYVCSRAAAQKLLSRYVRDGAIDVSGFRGVPVADELLYRSVRTYTATYPLYVENADFGSTLNSLRRLHVASHAVIRDIWNEGAHPSFAEPLEAAREPA
jgi:GR25 family glycosyltransferase involved in LPS biosynthesis